MCIRDRRLDEAFRILRTALHRDSGKLQPGDPALGAFFQRRKVLRGQLQSHAVFEAVSYTHLGTGQARSQRAQPVTQCRGRFRQTSDTNRWQTMQGV